MTFDVRFWNGNAFLLDKQHRLIYEKLGRVCSWLNETKIKPIEITQDGYSFSIAKFAKEEDAVAFSVVFG